MTARRRKVSKNSQSIVENRRPRKKNIVTFAESTVLRLLMCRAGSILAAGHTDARRHADVRRHADARSQDLESAELSRDAPAGVVQEPVAGEAAGRNDVVVAQVDAL